MSPKVVDKQKKREKILRSALKVFSDRGIADFKMIDIANTAGIGKGTIYEYFSGKEDIITGCFNIFMHDFGDILVSGLSEMLNPKEKIQKFFKLSFQYFSENQEAMSVLFDFWAAGIPRKHGKPIIPGIEKEYAEFQLFVSVILEDGIKQGLLRPHDTQTTALMILATLDGLMFQAVLGVIDITDKTLPDKISYTLLEGISNE
ncbi:MAG: TetR/AcrR family transcriptional regulator [candidate division Zixibacteria bacterium]|nr:TetR/AcrR family transcriptional regulator [candidate division Zixibacteria bacterium]